MAGTLAWLDPAVEQFVFSRASTESEPRGDGHQDRERILADVRRHWMASAGPAVRIGVALVAFSTAWLLGGLWLLLLIAAALGLTAQALWRMASHYRDRFVITDRRVFRVHGNLNQERVGLPLAAISAVEVDQSWPGRVFGYGTLRLAAAANDQGLTRVPWVPDPHARAEELEALVAEHRG